MDDYYYYGPSEAIRTSVLSIACVHVEYGVVILKPLHDSNHQAGWAEHNELSRSIIVAAALMPVALWKFQFGTRIYGVSISASCPGAAR